MFIFGMGRPRKWAIDKIESLLKPVADHIWKIYAYHSVRPDDVDDWIKDINIWMDDIRSYNVPKVGSKPNVSLKLMRDMLTDTYFGGLDDLKVKNSRFSKLKNPYPRLNDLDEVDVFKAQKISNIFIDILFRDLYSEIAFRHVKHWLK